MSVPVTENNMNTSMEAGGIPANTIYVGNLDQRYTFCKMRRVRD
jgi:hypothetical protein